MKFDLTLNRPVVGLSALAATFAAARQRIADGREPARLFVAQDWTPGPGYGRERPQTFAERRAAYAGVIENVRRIEAGTRHNNLRGTIIAETPACQNLIRRLRLLDTLPWGENRAAHAAQLEADLEAIIAGRMAELAVAA